LPINLKQIAISLSEAANSGLAGCYIVFALMGTSHYAINKNSETGSLSTDKGDPVPSTAITEENLRTAITRNYSCARVREFRNAGLDKTGSVYMVDCGNAIYQVFVDRKGVMTAVFACGDGWQCGITSRY
jgi:hypothetical protein